ncbi:MAG: ABC transporter permease [Thermoleophilia bacterium]|nr:ABC transporter permease [Thermoleophilia bacterium]
MSEIFTDVRTVMWKEAKSLFGRSRNLVSTIMTLLFPLVFSIWLSWDAGTGWLNSYLPSAALMYLLPLVLISALIPDSFAGERERRTLETLLASRLPDQAIFAGKILVAVLYGWGMSLFALVVGLVTVNAAHWSGGFHFYAAKVVAADVGLSLLFSTAVAGLGAVVSIKARGIRQAQQILSGTLVLPLFAIWLIVMVLGDRLSSLPRRMHGDWIVGALAAAVAAASALLFFIALRRFRRDRLLAD